MVELLRISLIRMGGGDLVQNPNPNSRVDLISKANAKKYLREHNKAALEE